MGKDDHLRAGIYRLSRAHRSGIGTLARCIHEHRIALCPACRQEWDRVGTLMPVYLERLERLAPLPEPSPEPPLEDVAGDDATLEVLAREAAEQRKERRRAKEDLWELLRLSHAEAVDRIRRSRRRFRSRKLAELMVEECRRRVRRDPLKAGQLAELVPLVLHWTQGPDGPPWAPPLLARAAAQRANALRVSGDLAAAEQSFIRLRRDLAARPIGDAAALGEVASLEASLYIAQRRFQEAEQLLIRADLSYRYGGDVLGQVRTRIKLGNLMQTMGKPEEALRLQAVAASHLGTAGDSYLVLCTVTGRVNALCDLGRCAEARRVLATHLDDFEASEEPHAGATVRCLEGRIELGLERSESAARAFAAASEAMLALGRDYDAALIALYQAEAYQQAGRTRELRALAAKLVPVFRSRNLAGEALQALGHFAQAVTADRVSAALLERLRQRIAAAAGTLDGP